MPYAEFVPQKDTHYRLGFLPFLPEINVPGFSGPARFVFQKSLACTCKREMRPA
jgi:hypothetical protein